MRGIRVLGAVFLAICLLPLPFGRAEEGKLLDREQEIERLRAQARSNLDVLEADAGVLALRSLERLRDELDRRRDRLLVALFHPVEEAKGRPAPAATRLISRIVARRLAALEEIWNDPRAVEVSPTTSRERQRLLESLRALAQRGDPAARLRRAASDLPALVGRPHVTIRTFNRKPDERTGQLYDAWVVDEYNAARDPELETEAREATRLTNAHRRMVGYRAQIEAAAPIRDNMNEEEVLALLRRATLSKRTPIRALRIDKRLAEAAQGHARAMAESGFFSHSTPIKFAANTGRFPSDRVRAAGYEAKGVSENLAAGAKHAKGVYQMWLQSPAQHRNLVGSWSDIGVARQNRRWVLNLALGDGGPMTRQPDLEPRRGS